MNMKDARKSKGYTQEYVAKILGISRTTYNKYENGVHEPDSKALLKLSELLDVSTDFLLGKNELQISDEPENMDLLNKTLNQLIGQQDGILFFEGKPLDDETKKLLIDSIKDIIKMAKKMNSNDK